MKTYRLINAPRWMAGLMLFPLCLSLLAGCSQLRNGGTGSSSSQANMPPIPKEPAATLQMPPSVRAEEKRGQATLPEELKLGFAIDLADRVVSADLDIQATIKNIENRTVVFQTDKGETGHLVYRLPPEIPLSLKVGQPINIKRKFRGFEMSAGYELAITSEGNPLLASGRVSGDKPLEIRIGKDLVLRQVEEQRLVGSQSKYETTYQIPVVLNANNAMTAASIGKPAELGVEGKSFIALIMESARIVPTKEYEGVAEGRGYTLEYVVALRVDRDIPK
jgi:hypothetical protein